MKKTIKKELKETVKEVIPPDNITIGNVTANKLKDSVNKYLVYVNEVFVGYWFGESKLFAPHFPDQFLCGYKTWENLHGVFQTLNQFKKVRR